MNEKTNKGFRVKYKFKDDYTPLYVNGVYGGYSPQREFVLHFYQERWPIPNEQKLDEKLHEIKEEVVPSDFNNIIIRTMQSGLIMNREMIISLRDFLNEFLETTQKEEVKSNEHGKE